MYDSEAFQAVRARLLEIGGVFNAPRVRKDSLFGRLIRADTPLLTDDLAYELSIGRSTLVSDLKRLRTELTPYRLSILGKTRKGLVPEGRESDIRQYLLERAYNALYQDYPLDQEILELFWSWWKKPSPAAASAPAAWRTSWTSSGIGTSPPTSSPNPAPPWSPPPSASSRHFQGKAGGALWQRGDPGTHLCHHRPSPGHAAPAGEVRGLRDLRGA